MGRYERPVSVKEKFKAYVKLTLPVVAIVMVIAVLLLNGKESGVSLVSGSNTELIVKNPDSIAIPGYESITLEADKKTQSISFPNPSQNTCLFVITLRLEDGTVLWRSKEIKPGKTSQNITLEQALPKGTYPNAVLEYECFQDNADRTKLNGAATKLTLLVK